MSVVPSRFLSSLLPSRASSTRRNGLTGRWDDDGCRERGSDVDPYRTCLDPIASALSLAAAEAVSLIFALAGVALQWVWSRDRLRSRGLTRHDRGGRADEDLSSRP